MCAVTKKQVSPCLFGNIFKSFLFSFPTSEKVHLNLNSTLLKVLNAFFFTFRAGRVISPLLKSKPLTNRFLEQEKAHYRSLLKLLFILLHSRNNCLNLLANWGIDRWMSDSILSAIMVIQRWILHILHKSYFLPFLSEIHSNLCLFFSLSPSYIHKSYSNGLKATKEQWWGARMLKKKA